VTSYIKETYPLIDVKGKGKDAAKIYLVENKDVPTVAKELAAQEEPEEMSKESAERMFLVYYDSIINLAPDPDNSANTLIEVNPIEYVKEHYDSSFLEGYVTATLLQILFGGDWNWSGGGTSDSRGYPSAGKTSTVPQSADSSKRDDKPATSDRTGSFSSKGSAGSSAGSTGSSAGSSGGAATNTGKSDSGKIGTSKPNTSGTFGTFTSKNSGSSGSSSLKRKNDGSTPSYKISTPKTSTRIGSFSSKKR